MTSDYEKRSKLAIHHGALTNSKRKSCFTENYPSHFTRGVGCMLVDESGRRYIDYICALGVNLFGYGNDFVKRAVIDQLNHGTLFSMGSTLEVDAAERVKEILPFIDKVRFLKTGSEAAMAACRIAMAHTGRKKILSHGYHGMWDSFVGLTEPALGVNKSPFIDTLRQDSFDQLTEEIACVIVEPVITDFSDERIKYLNDLKLECNKKGIILIFDEIITGFRFPNYCVSNYFGIRPDIILLGKCIAGGLPLSIVGTAKGIGDDKEWFISSTFAGDTLALAAFMRVTDLLKNKYNINYLWNSGQKFYDLFNQLYPEKLKLIGYPTRGVFHGDDLTMALFFQESVKCGMLFGPSFFYNFDHMNQNEIVLSNLQDIFRRIKTGQVVLNGEMPKKPFAQAQRNNN